METEKSEINWQLVCRICLQSSDSDMKLIFGVPSVASDKDIAGKIIKCGGVPVKIDDGMPNRICSQCSIDLEIAFNFQNSCQGSYYQLLNFIKSREHAKDVKLETEHTTDFIKVETDFNYEEPDCFPEEPKLSIRSTENLVFSNADEQQYYWDNVCPPKVSDEGLSHHIKKELTSQNIEKSIEIPRSRSIKEKKNGTRGQKPHPINKFICHICGNIYDMQSRLRQHIKQHTVKKKHECEICGRKFAYAAQIPRHMNTHTGNRPYKCKYCPSSFGDCSTRNKHERIHTNERPFQCLECGKSFTYAHVLKVHMSIHTGEKPYSCSICGRSFSQRHHMQLHEKTHSNLNRRNAKIQ